MSDLFKTACVVIEADLDQRTVTFRIEKDVLHVPPAVAERYVFNIKNNRFATFQTPSGVEMKVVVQGSIEGEPNEWEFVFPMMEIPHHTSLVEAALQRLHRTRN